MSGRDDHRCAVRSAAGGRERGRVWLYVDKQLKAVRLRLGVSDGTFTEILNEGDLQANASRGHHGDRAGAEHAARPEQQQNNPLMGPQRGGLAAAAGRRRSGGGGGRVEANT